MKLKPIIILLVLAVTGLLITTAPASANSISLNDLQLISSQVVVYAVNESGTCYMGTYNTSDTLTLSPLDNYVFVFKPNTASYALNTPEGIFGYIDENMDIIFKAAIVIAFITLIVFAIGWGRR